MKNLFYYLIGIANKNYRHYLIDKIMKKEKLQKITIYKDLTITFTLFILAIINLIFIRSVMLSIICGVGMSGYVIYIFFEICREMRRK
jgi:hypothetical protein